MPDLILDAAAPPPTRRRVVGGKRIVERIPRTAQDPKRPNVKYQRWVTMLDHYGNSVFCVMTTAAAEVIPEGKYASDMQRKFRKYGWFNYGKCPVAAVQNGDLRPGKLLVDIDGATPCRPGAHSDMDPCPHAIAEQAARQAKNLEKDRAMQQAWKSNDLKQAEEQTKALMALAEKQAGGDVNNEVLKAMQAQTEAIMALVQSHAEGSGKRK